jgi:acetoin utilization protein AcuB
MIVRNWMMRNPKTVTGDTLISKAKRILVEHGLRALPVVDEEGHLRGLLTRVACLRAAEFVTRTQDPHEFEYFANRLQVKDLMVRNPQSVNADDTIEVCLRRGQDEKRAQFPVIESGKVVGLVSANEMFYLAAQILGVWQQWSGITVGPLEIKRGTLGQIAKAVEDGGAVLEGMFAVSTGEKDNCKRVIVRFSGADPHTTAAAIEAAGFNVVELCSLVVPQLPGNGRVINDEIGPPSGHGPNSGI